MSEARLGWVMSLMLALAACGIGRPVRQPTTYTLQPTLPESGSLAARRPESLRVGRVRVASAFAGAALVYRTSDVQLISDPYHQFITEPGMMLGDQMADWLDRSGPFRTVARPDSSQPAYYVLEATVTEIYGDFRPRQAPAAVLAMQFTLIDESGVRPRSVFEQVIARRVDIPQAVPDALVRGYAGALTEILAELTADLQGPSARYAPRQDLGNLRPSEPKARSADSRR
jgi:uncharacterized lipoprotein YmbA